MSEDQPKMDEAAIRRQAAAFFGAAGGRAGRGEAKARTRAQARRAGKLGAAARWAKRQSPAPRTPPATPEPKQYDGDGDHY